jgi:hypothetical protein
LRVINLPHSCHDINEACRDELIRFNPVRSNREFFSKHCFAELSYIKFEKATDYH